MESTASNEAGKSDALAVNFTFAKAPKPHSFIDNPSKTNKLKASIIHHPDVTPDFRRSSHTRRSLQSQGWIETQSDSGSFAVPMTPESLDNSSSYILSNSNASSRYRPNFPMPKPEEVDDSFDIFDQGASQRAASVDARDDSEQYTANPLQERIARMKSKSKTPRGVPFASSSQSMLPHMTDSPVNLNSQLPRNSNFTNPKLKTIANIQSASHRSSLPSFPRHAQLIDDAQRYSADRSASPAPRGRSVAAMRSASVESVVLPENRADPSSLDGMMATLQTWRAENKDLKLSLADIEAQLSSVKEERDTYLSEKTELEGRLAAAKAKGLEAVKTASERVEELKKELLGLKESADATVESSAGLTDVASELEALKDGSAKALALVESFFDAEQGYNFKLADSRSLILELQEQLAQLDKDASNKQQVIDLLRERLETSTGEYLEQKDRMLTLEQEQGKNAIELRRVAASLSRTGEDLAKLKECQTQLVDALTAAAELEAELNVANPRISELEEELRNASESSQAKIASLEALSLEGQKQCAELNGSLTSAEAQITELRSERDELLASNAVSLLKLETLSTLEAEVGDLRIKAANSNVIPSLRDEIAALLTSNGTLRAEIEVLEAERTDISRLRGAEIQVLNLTETASDLQKKFDAANAQTMKERDAKLKAEAVREELQGRLIQQEIEWKGEVKSLQDQLKQSEVDREVLSQRLDIEKAKFEEQHSQLNGNLLGSEMTCRIKDVEIRELQEILKERDAVLSSLPHLRERLQGAEEDRTKLQAELTKATNELEISGKVVEIMRETQQNLHAEVASLRAINDETKSRSLDRANDAAELIKALESFRSDKSEFESSRDGHERELRGTITDLQVHLDNERTESKKASERIEELTSQLLEAEEQLKSFPERFEKGGALKEAELAIVQVIMHQCQRVVEQQLVTKGNDIRRRDVIIKGLESRIKSLESLLAKQLDAKARADAAAGHPTRSLIDLDNWMASSPPHPQADAENVKVADARLNDSAPASHATQTADIYSSSVSLIPVAANKKSQPITYRRTKLTVLDKTASERGSTEPFAQISSNGNVKRKETDQNVLVPGSSSPLSSASSPTMSKPTKTTGATANNKKRANDSVEIIPKPGKKKRTDERKVEFGISTGTQDGAVVAGGSDAPAAAPTTAASRRGRGTTRVTRSGSQQTAAANKKVGTSSAVVDSADDVNVDAGQESTSGKVTRKRR